MPIRPHAVALAVAVLILTGCTPTSGEEPEPTTKPASIEAGMCLASATADADPDLDSIVDCAEPHIYEVTGTFAVPVAWLDPAGSVEEIEAQRAALLEADGANRAALLELSAGFCEQQAGAAAGIDRPLAGIPARDAKLRPFGGFWIDLSLPPAGRIAANGDARAVCAIGFWDFDSISRSLASASSTPLIDGFLSPEAPLALRSCLAYDEGIVAESDCAEPHWAEPFAEFDAGIFGEEFLDRARTALRENGALAREDLTLIGDACREAFAGLVDAGNPTTTVQIRGAVWHDWTQLPGDYWPAVCAFAAEDDRRFDIAGGSRVGVAEGDAELVPAG